MLHFRVPRLLLAASVALLMCAGMAVRTHVRAEIPQLTWLDESQSITVSNGSTMTDEQYSALRDKTLGLYAGLTCATGSVSTGDCWYDTSAGQIAQTGMQVQLRGMEAPGYIVDTVPDPADMDGYSPQLQTVVPTRYSGVFLQLVQDPGSGHYHVYFRTSATMQVSAVQNPWGAPFYVFDTPVSDAAKVPELIDAAGAPLSVDEDVLYNDTTYSADGRQLALYDQSGRVTMVDLQDFTMRTIRVPDAPNDGSVPFALVAPSDDGTYLAVSVAGGDLGVYDLQRCDTAGQVPQVCPERELGISLAIATGNRFDYPLGGGVPQFVDDALLEYTLSDGAPSGHFQYYLRAPNTWQANYVALGDSYASGEGAGSSNFYPETNVSGVNQCHLSPLSYPYLIGQDLQLSSTHSAACSGAKIADVLTNAQYKTVPSNNTLGDWLPGPQPQLQKITKQTNVITISAVGNDVGFGDIVQRCIMESDTCYGTYEDREELVLLINKQFDRLVDTYTQLKHAAAPDARIYVIGYPQIVNPGGRCGDNVRLNYSETIFAHDLIDDLDSVIEKAAARAGVYYVSDSTVFEGHRLCDSSTQKAVNGITIQQNGNSWTNNSFHPNPYGHALLAKWIEENTYNFTAPMPRADSAVGEPTVDDSLPILQAPKSNRPLNELNYDNNLSNDVVYWGKIAHIEYDAEKGVVDVGEGVAKAYSTVKGWIHSEPIYLGSFTTDGNGNFSVDVTIPTSVPPGFHTLDFYVAGVDGQTQDIRKTIYVAASPDDYDGDGVPNALEPCIFFKAPANQSSGDDYDCSINNMSSSDPSSVYTDTQAMNSKTSAPYTDARTGAAPAVTGHVSADIKATPDENHPAMYKFVLLAALLLVGIVLLLFIVSTLRGWKR